MTDDRKPVRARPSLVPYLIPIAGGFLGTVALALLMVFGRSAGGGAAGEPTAPPAVSAVSASCTRAPSRDSVGNPTSYEPARAVDGDPTTAWRCAGDGSGSTSPWNSPARSGSHGSASCPVSRRPTRRRDRPLRAEPADRAGPGQHGRRRRRGGAGDRRGRPAGAVHRRGRDHPVGHGDDPAQRPGGGAERPGGRRLRGDLGDRRVVSGHGPMCTAAAHTDGRPGSASRVRTTARCTASAGSAPPSSAS